MRDAMELKRLSLVSRQRPEVLELEWQIYAASQHWDLALQVAQELMKIAPRRSFGWIHQAYSLRRVPGGGLDRAWQALPPAVKCFRRRN